MSRPRTARSSARPSLGSILTLARTSRWLAFGCAAVLAAAGCVAMGMWQWHRMQEVLAAERAVLAVPTSLESLADVGGALSGSSIGRAVVATGTWEGSGQQLVTPRLLADERGSWVLTALRLPDGSVQPVVRGWIPPASGAPVPPGPVRMSGTLQPTEAFYADAEPPPGSLVALSDRLIAERLPGPLRPGVVFLATAVPNAVDAPRPVPVPPASGIVTFPLQNASYALQWIVFAAFALGAYVFLLVKEAGRADEPPADYRGAS